MSWNDHDEPKANLAAVPSRIVSIDAECDAIAADLFDLAGKAFTRQDDAAATRLRTLAVRVTRLKETVPRPRG